MATEAEAATPRSWHAITQETLKRNKVRLAVYVPDRVLTPLIKALHEDNDFTGHRRADRRQARSRDH